MRIFVRSATFAVIAVCVLVVPSAKADMGMPGMKRVAPTHQIIASEPFPNHTFLVYRRFSRRVKDEQSGKEVLASVTEAAYVEVTPDRPLVVAPEGQRFEQNALLLIVPRATADRYPSALDLATTVLADQRDDVVRYVLSFRESVPQWHGDELTISHRVNRVHNSECLQVARTTSEQGYQCCLAALLCPVSALLGGLLLVRWLLQSVQKTQHGENPNSPKKGARPTAWE